MWESQTLCQGKQDNGGNEGEFHGCWLEETLKKTDHDIIYTKIKKIVFVLDNYTIFFRRIGIIDQMTRTRYASKNCGQCFWSPDFI